MKVEPFSSRRVSSTLIRSRLSFCSLRSALLEAIKTMPELAEEVHIFSTFLYTKLSNKKYVEPSRFFLLRLATDASLSSFRENFRKAKDGGDPWEVVARWTRKFDIFQKKFLIVPINEE